MVMNEDGTYYRAPNGWTCFHCGETFTTPGSAEDHFGATPDKIPGCKIKFGDEMGLLMKLRKAEAREAEQKQRADIAEAQAESAVGELAAFQHAGKCQSSHDLRMKIDSLEGEAVTARVLIEAIREKVPELYAAVIG